MGNSKKAGYRASGSNNPIRPHGRKYSSSICSQTAKEVREAPLHGPALCSQGYEASSYRRQLLHSSGGSKKGRRNRRMPLFFLKSESLDRASVTVTKGMMPLGLPDTSPGRSGAWRTLEPELRSKRGIFTSLT